ncbi:hypothetical protein BE221DRAFT_81275 [Ostreococcus tauri]|uniref:Uncharacterized protein n=1 Tax=Ostreococcus tauri TaxID=70448 RepID=A0A1Y5I7P3_OSTTA|nr:hypothetical protein BE221DRAFT_81275 [Ostreococcus tauri]
MPRETRTRKPVSYANSGSSTPAWMCPFVQREIQIECFVEMASFVCRERVSNAVTRWRRRV